MHLHRIELAALVHLEGKGDQAIHRDGPLPSRSGSSDYSVLSEANTTPGSPEANTTDGPGEHGVVLASSLWLEANSKDEPSFSETVETFKADAAAQECVVQLFSRVLDRCIAVGISRAHACASTALLARVRGGKLLPTVVRRAIGDCVLSAASPLDGPAKEPCIHDCGLGRLVTDVQLLSSFAQDCCQQRRIRAEEQDTNVTPELRGQGPMSFERFSICAADPEVH